MTSEKVKEIWNAGVAKKGGVVKVLPLKTRHLKTVRAALSLTENLEGLTTADGGSLYFWSQNLSMPNTIYGQAVTPAGAGGINKVTIAVYAEDDTFAYATWNGTAWNPYSARIPLDQLLETAAREFSQV